MSPRTSSDALSHIITISRDFNTRHPLPSTTRSRPPPPEHWVTDCILPEPQPLRLEPGFEIDHAIAEQLSTVYLRAALQVKAEYEKQFRRIYRNYIQLSSHLCPDISRLQSLLRSTYVSNYTQRLDTWVEEIKVRILSAKQKQPVGSNVHGRNRRSFSQRSISILEEFFKDNAFPSRLEKHGLAADANLTQTQVHIWFQNRRRRSRKEGKELKRSDRVVLLPSELETSVLELLASTEPNANLNEGFEDSADAPANPLNSVEVPQHAFPSVYPPACSYDPFPIAVGVRKFSRPWIRNTSSTCTSRSQDIDVTQLTESFMQLTLVDDSQAELHVASRSQHASSSCLSNVLGFTTITSRAPLPALIPAAVTTPSMPRAHVFAQQASLNAGRPRASSSQPVLPASRSQRPVSRKKVAPLPKRLPTTARVTHDGESYATLQHPSSRRPVAPLPKRAARPAASIRPSPSPPPFVLPFVSTPSRMPSASSSISSESSSPSGPDTPLISTPPPLPAPLTPSKISVSCALGLESSFSSLSNGSSFGGYSSIDCLQVELGRSVSVFTYDLS